MGIKRDFWKYFYDKKRQVIIILYVCVSKN